MHCAGAVTDQSQQSAKAAVFLLALCRATGRNRTCSDSYAEFKPLEMFSSVKVDVKLSDFTAHRRTDANQSQEVKASLQARENESCSASRGSLFIVQTVTTLTDSHLLSGLEYLCNKTWNAAKAKGRLGKTNRREDKWLT